MPELPEVETIRRGLAQYLPGRRIKSLSITADKLVHHPSPKEMMELVQGQAYREVRRLGKILLVDLERHTLMIRLGMTGQLTFRTPDRQDQPFETSPLTGLQSSPQHAPDKHTHIIAEHCDGTQLCYRDIRKFGCWFLFTPQELAECPILKDLGPDPFTPAYTYEALSQALEHTSRALKTVLLDQGVVAGLGNIYADEALFLAELRPDRPADELDSSEMRRLFEVIPAVLQQGIDNRGTTFSDYRDADGNKGDNVSSLKAYGRHGQPCLNCGTTMEKIHLGGRTGSWCPHCQH